MKFLSKEEVMEGSDKLHSVIETLFETQDVEILTEHLLDLSAIQASASLLYSSSKVLYLKNKKDAELAGLYAYTESLIKSCHYKMMALSSAIKKEGTIKLYSK